MLRIFDQPTTRPVEWVFSLVAVLSIALLWVGLFKLNMLLFSYIGVSQYISWIFLPAAIRMLAVMMMEWVGALGLFVGALLTSEPVAHTHLSEIFIVAGLSAVGPLVAVAFCTKWLRMPANLAGLKPRQLCLFALVGALCNVIPHNIYFYISDQMHSPFTGLIPMFVGDLTGTILVLYVSALLLKFFLPVKKPS